MPAHKSVLQECPTRVPRKSVPQECPASDPQECPTRVSHKSVPEECPARVSHKSVLKECPTRAHKSAPQQCPTRASCKCPTRVSYKSVPEESHKGVPQECPTRVSHKSFLQECPTRVSHKSVPQECPTRVSRKSVPQECPASLSDNVGGHRDNDINDGFIYVTEHVAHIRKVDGSLVPVLPTNLSWQMQWPMLTFEICAWRFTKVLCTKSAHAGSQSAVPATKSALQETSENSNPNGGTIPTMPENDPRMTRDRLAPILPQTLTCQLRSHRFH